MKAEPILFDFTWTDAWVLTALYCSHKSGDPFDLLVLLRVGEDLNFNTFRLDELNESLTRLSKKGIIQIRDNEVVFLPLGKQLISKARFRLGGWFSRVDITLKLLNSSATGTAGNHAASHIPIIDREKYEEAYALFLKQPVQAMEYASNQLPKTNQETTDGGFV